MQNKNAVIARRPQADVAIRPPNRVIARLRRSRGNLRAPKDVKFRMNDTARRLPRPLRGLAMTDVVEDLHPGFDFLCHCEGR